MAATDEPRQDRSDTPPGGRERPPDPPGWRVEGTDEREPPPARRGRFPLSSIRPPGGRWFWWVLIGLLALNWYIQTMVPEGPRRVDVPYTFFREQVSDGNVVEITSRADTIQGEFTKAVAPEEPDGSSGQDPAKLFETERPAFADDELMALLINEDVVVNARPPDEGRPVWEALLIGFGPTILLVALFILIMRRAAGA